MPAPATLAILGARNIPVSQCDEPHELVTPTGAALLAEFVESFGAMENLVAEKIGFGLGTRENKTRPNVLRAVLGTQSKVQSPKSEAGSVSSPAVTLDWETDRVAVLETNLDDCTGEILGAFVETALAAGALDVFHTPIQMKKNRPGVLLTVLCAETDADKFSELILRETTAFGVRKTIAERRKLRREFADVKTAFGKVTVKIGRLGGKVVQAAPEFESVKKLAAQKTMPVKLIYETCGSGRKKIESDERSQPTNLEKLRALLKSYGSCLVAYSGGVDSVFLARVAHDMLGDRALAAIADSASLPRRELQEALDIAAKFSFPVRVLQTQEFANENYTANPANRCYFCKHELFEELTPLARAENFAVIAYGENASDVGDFRPGAQAAAEFQVCAPLKEAGLTKAEIRELSAQLGLPTADKPQMACLSSRVPYGETVTPEKLRMIELAEYALRDLGFHDVRVRHHELPIANRQFPIGNGAAVPNGSDKLKIGNSKLEMALARIEVGPVEMQKFLADGVAGKIAAALKQIGYAHVTLDLQGYRRGSTNEILAAGKNGSPPKL